MKNSYRSNQHGFSLIELMITVAIIGILASVAYPSYVAQIQKGNRAECRSGLLQSMQQQERFYSQYNSYTTFSSGSTTANTKSFSGESLQNSACAIAADPCQVGGVDQALTQCIQLNGTMRTGSDPVSMLSLSSQGAKSCTYNGAANTTGQSACWQ